MLHAIRFFATTDAQITDVQNIVIGELPAGTFSNSTSVPLFDLTLSKWRGNDNPVKNYPLLKKCQRSLTLHFARKARQGQNGRVVAAIERDFDAAAQAIFRLLKKNNINFVSCRSERNYTDFFDFIFPPPP